MIRATPTMPVRVTSAITLAALLLSLGGAHVEAQSPPVPGQVPAPAPPAPAPQNAPLVGPTEPPAAAATEPAPAVPTVTTTESPAPPPAVLEAPPAADVALPPAELPPGEATAAAAQGEAPSRAAPYALWAVGGASLVTGAVLGILALKAKSDFEDGPTTKRADKVHDLGIAADVGLGLGLILAITGTVFYLRDDPPSESTARAGARTLSRLEAAPLVGAHRAGGVLSLRF